MLEGVITRAGAVARPERAHHGITHRVWSQRALPWLVTRFATGQVRLVGGERIPAEGPVLFLGRHRAGLMDGWVYSAALPRRTVFMVAAARRTNPFLRIFVAGIEVARRKDGGDRGADSGRNRAALAACRAELGGGGTVFVFPEGTSSLGPRHLPFERGAAVLAQRCPAALIVPLDINYVDATRIGTDVDVVVGRPFRLRPGNAAAQIVAAMEQTGADFPDAAAQNRAEAAARAAWAAGGSYSAALRRSSRLAPAPASRRCGGRRVFGAVYGVLNLPVALVLAGAGRFADGGNVVLAWKVLVGLPVQLAWAAAVLLACAAAGWPWLAAAYVALTLAGVRRHG